jgi:hypothetical protein
LHQRFRKDKRASRTHLETISKEEDPSQPPLQRGGVVNRQIPPANISPLLRGVRRGLKFNLKSLLTLQQL